MSVLTVVQNRPQGSPQNTEPSIEVEKQTIIELNPSPFHNQQDSTTHHAQRNIEESTREILEKIAEVNKQQGLTKRKDRPNYFHFPFSYSRSQEEKQPYQRQSDGFRFPNNPFTNPILEYLEREQQKEGRTKSKNDLKVNELENDAQIITQPSVGITKDDLVPNQYVKRKIVHQQTILMPNPNFMQPLPNSMPPQSMLPYPMPSPVNLEQLIPYVASLSNENKEKSNKTGDNKNLSKLEKQTVDNVRNIVSSSQLQAYPSMYNPYTQYMQGYPQSQYPYGPMTPYDMGSSSGAQGYGIYDTSQARQNWNWPGASYFPIYIRDPFLQLYNAVTSMVEYGPNAGQGGPCKRPNRNKVKGKEDSSIREAKTTDDDHDSEKISFEINEGDTPQITINGFDSDENNSSYLDIENIDLGTNSQNSLKLTVKVKSGERIGKESETTKSMKTSWDKVDKANNATNLNKPTAKYEKFEETKEFRPPLFFKPQTKPPATPAPIKNSANTVTSILTKDQIEALEEKGEDVSISNDGNKKLFSRDNTGSGIFIHKLKVRKGGVAIAGPGGIATAGSGGTAIVGPNGVAYTHPDSLAIAGSGTKVVAVDPSINLSDLISNATNSRPNAEGFPPSRVGRVVAVGPVVYYNRG